MLTTNAENIDYLAEVVVSHLLAGKNISDTRVSVRLMGIFRRFFSRDVDKIITRNNAINQEEWEVFLHREGFYDILPEGFFHASSKKYFKNHEEIIREFRQHKKEENDARLFFLPLEQEFYDYRFNKEIVEQDFYFAPETIHEFVSFYNLTHLGLTGYQKAALFFIMPFIPSIAGSLALTQTCFEIILQEEVRFEILKQQNSCLFSGELTEVGNLTLGLDSNLGNVVIDNNPRIEIEIGPLMKSDDLISYISGSNRELVDWLISLFMQADLACEVTIRINSGDETFMLAGKAYESRLGYSTSI